MVGAVGCGGGGHVAACCHDRCTVDATGRKRCPICALSAAAACSSLPLFLGARAGSGRRGRTAATGLNWRTADARGLDRRRAERTRPAVPAVSPVRPFPPYPPYPRSCCSARTGTAAVAVAGGGHAAQPPVVAQPGYALAAVIRRHRRRCWPTSAAGRRLSASARSGGGMQPANPVGPGAPNPTAPPGRGGFNPLDPLGSLLGLFGVPSPTESGRRPPRLALRRGAVTDGRRPSPFADLDDAQLHYLKAQYLASLQMVDQTEAALKAQLGAGREVAQAAPGADGRPATARLEAAGSAPRPRRSRPTKPRRQAGQEADDAGTTRRRPVT